MGQLNFTSSGSAQNGIRMGFIRHWSVFQVSIVTIQLCKSLNILGSNNEPFDCCLCMSCRVGVGFTKKETGRKQEARKREAVFSSFLPFFTFFLTIFL